MFRPHLLALALAIGSGSADGQDPPVVIYLHGRIIEDQGPDAVSPRFGDYAYRAILDSLRASGFQVLSEVRPAGTDVDEYAGRVVAQIDSLLAAGVLAARIAVVGFSKGGGIAKLASAKLKRTDVTFVFLASCDEDDRSAYRVAGRVLSVFEASDPLGQSCRTVFGRALEGTIHEERVIRTGLGHGAFYRPREEWLDPVRTWIRSALPARETNPGSRGPPRSARLFSTRDR